MERSLLSLLKEEDKLVRNINGNSDMISRFERRFEETSNIPYECKTKERDLKNYRALINDYKNDTESCKNKLDAVRDNLKRYINEMLK